MIDMTDDAKQMLQLHLEFMKKTMKENGVILGIAVSTDYADESKIVFIDKESYMKDILSDGFSVSLTDFNKDLF